MEITVRYFTVLREVTKKRQETIEMKQNSTLEDMLSLLIKKYGANFERYVLSGRETKGLQLILLLNEQDTSQLSGFKTQLHNRDIVAVIPPVAGG